jgi:hypothetical protein
LGLVEGVDADVHLASARCEEQVMLFVEVQMTNAETIAKGAP